MRTQLALLLTLVLAAFMASNALATTPRDDAETPDTSPAEVGIATPSEAPGVRVSRLAAAAACSSGAHTLSKFGDRVYPEMGNGGYTSVHSDVHIAYDTATNMFLPGTHVVHTDKATQCLTDFSLDFERTNTERATARTWPSNAITVNGQPATSTFVQPTYPGDPNGQDDPDPAAHAVSNANPVSATNPNPPACSPQVSGNAPERHAVPGQQARDHAVGADRGRRRRSPCASTTPAGRACTSTATARPRAGSASTRRPRRTTAASSRRSPSAPRPGCRSTTTRARSRPTTSTTPCRSARPRSRTASSSARRIGSDVRRRSRPRRVNAPDANFPGGSWTWHWHSPEPIANYLVENSIGSYDLVGPHERVRDHRTTRRSRAA